MDTTYDPFEELAKRWSVVTIHNVLLVDVQPGEGGFERLMVQHEGRSRELAGGGRWSEEFSRRDVGRHGHLVPVSPTARDNTPLGACYFRAYADPSLRRVPELDNAAGDRGWRCDASPQGLVAPAGIIPGEHGRYVHDQTIGVTVKVPPEFVRECRRVQRTPKQLLEGFIADAAGIQNYVSCPRADGMGSNGSDERDMAEAWIQRAYGMDAVDVDELESRDEEEQERQLAREDFGNLLDDFIGCGGTEDELHAAVQALIEQQRAKGVVDGASAGPSFLDEPASNR
jgi:hypothetical protein